MAPQAQRHHSGMIESIRKASDADASAISSLVNAAYRPPPGQSGWTHESDIVDGERTNIEQLLAQIRQRDSVVFVGLRDAAIIACIHIDRDGPDCNLGMFAVQPALQGTGVGKQLLAYAERYALESMNAIKLTMLVVSGRTELIDFYLRRGYRRSGVTMNYPHDAQTGVPKRPDLVVECLEK